MILKATRFIGEVPRLAARHLPDNAAQEVFDSRLTDGNLVPVRRSGFVASLTSPPEGGFKSFFLDGNDWLGWADPVDVARGPVADDRLYITGDGVPKLKVGVDTYPLALAKPSGALTATSGGGGSGPETTLLYVYTWVTGMGEESEPCPVSNEVVWKPGETITLSGFASAPAGRNITKQRIYRSQTSASGVTSFFFLDERSASNADYPDAVDLDALVEPLSSLYYNPPPDDLTGIKPMPNGMMVAFSGKDLCFSEPWIPHAWPEKYRLTCDWDIVALACFGTTVVVATKGMPYIASGTDPSTMAMDRIEVDLPCINARSMIDLGYTASYASPDGLVTVGATGARVATDALFTKEGWTALNPATLVAGRYNGRYFASYDYVDANGEQHRGTAIIDLSGSQPFLIRSRSTADALWHDLQTGDLYMLRDGANIYRYDAPGQPNEMQGWVSKVFVTPRPVNFGCILIEADRALTEEELDALAMAAEDIEEANATLLDDDSILGDMNSSLLGEVAINGDTLQEVPEVDQSCTVNIYADGRLVASVGTLNRVERLPSGFLATKWEIEASSNITITQITLAGSPTELRQAA